MQDTVMECVSCEIEWEERYFFKFDVYPTKVCPLFYLDINRYQTSFCLLTNKVDYKGKTRKSTSIDFRYFHKIVHKISESLVLLSSIQFPVQMINKPIT